MTRNIPLLALALLLLAGSAAAQSKTKSIAPMIDETTVVVVCIDPSQLPPDMAIRSEKPPTDPWKMLGMVAGSLGQATEGKSVYGVGSLSGVEKIPFFIHAPKLDAKGHERLMVLLDAHMRLKNDELRGRPVLRIDDRNTIELLKTIEPQERPELIDAFESVDGCAIQFIVIPPAYLRRAFNEQVEKLPQVVGGGETSILTEGVQWLAIGANFNDRSLKLTVQSDSPDAAQALADYIPTMARAITAAIAQAGEDLEPTEAVMRTLTSGVFLEAWLAKLTPSINGDQVVFTLDKTDADAMTALFNTQLPELMAERQYRTHKSLKQIMLAMHNHHDTYKSFPVLPEHRDEDGKPYLSWRVHILPFLEEYKLYKEFHLDEPWDSEHNIKLLDRMPDVFKVPSQADVGLLTTAPPKRNNIRPGHTVLQAPVGEGTIMGGEEPTRMAQIIDGTSNTIVVVRVEDHLARPWTAPIDYKFSQEDPCAGLEKDKDGYITAGFCDGSTGDVLATPKQALRLFIMNDGEVVSYERR